VRPGWARQAQPYTASSPLRAPHRDRLLGPGPPDLPVGACYGENGASYVNDKVLQSNLDPFNPSNSSFHPSAKGYNGYFQALINNQ